MGEDGKDSHVAGCVLLSAGELLHLLDHVVVAKVPPQGHPEPQLPEEDVQVVGVDHRASPGGQHLALEVEDLDALHRAKEHIEGEGIEVLGPVNHGIFKSIYFFDPNGHRIELATNTGTPEQMRMLNEVAPAMLQEWSETRRAPKHAAWLHA